MKRTLLVFSVLAAVICCTLAFASTGGGAAMKAATADPSAKITENNTNYGVSIGTIEAQLYSEFGLNIEYFGNPEYVAQPSEGTYMGFESYGEWVYDDETDEEKWVIKQMVLKSINSTEEAVTIPDSLRVDDHLYPVSEIYGNSYLREGFNNGIKILTIPSTVTSIYNYYDFDRNLDAIYMLGSAPAMHYGYFNVPKIYVCNRSDFGGYLNSEYFSYSNILPYGWDFEWITVNVEKTGEFAETYLTQNDYDWSAAQYVKVTGNINDIDLSAIKNLTSLMKLDLSETAITSLPQSFMYERRFLTEVKLPSTLESIGNYAFYGCSSLQTFNLNGIANIGSSVFRGCSSLTYINLKGVETIGVYAFAYCSSLDGIDLSSVLTLGDGAFLNCISLKAADLSSIIKIGTYSSSSDGYGCFYNCRNLDNVTLGENLEFIGSGCFSGTGFKEFKLPEGLTTVYPYTFSNCDSLNSVTLPSTVKTIGDGAFYNCQMLSNVDMNTGLTDIQNSAFYGCTSLEEVSIPATVKSIGYGAFSNTAIKDFKCYAVVPPVAESSFIGENMDMTRTYLYVPPFSKDFYRNTEYWSNFYLMRSIEDQIDYILVDRPLTINLEEEDNEVVANNPEIVLTTGSYGYTNTLGQLTAIGEGTLSAGQLRIDATLARRSRNSYQYCPTLINYADKMRADDVTVNMWLNNYNSSNEWHFISLPFDVKVSDIIPGDGTYWAIRRYDSAARAVGETAETWVNLSADDTMEAGKGYIVSAAGGETYTDEYGYSYTSNPILTFSSGNSVTKNNIFRSSDVAVALTEYPAEFAHNRSWNLIGNPYPCYFDMHYLNSEFTAPVTVWNGSSYVAYSPVDDDLVLSPYEAFFVQCPLDAKEMTFKEAGRLHSNDGKPLYKIPSMSTQTISVEDRNVFNFELSNKDSFDRARIVLNPEASMEYEVGRDASKFFADGNACGQIYVAGDVAYSISERPVGEGLATLGLRTYKEETYTLSLSGRYSAEWHVIVTDNQTGISVDLTENEYEFTASTEDPGSRFSVQFQVGTETGVDSVISKFGDNAEVTVTAINGQHVFTGRLADMSVPTAGIYVISNGKEMRKVILK